MFKRNPFDSDAPDGIVFVIEPQGNHIVGKLIRHFCPLFCCWEHYSRNPNPAQLKNQKKSTHSFTSAGTILSSSSRFKRTTGFPHISQRKKPSKLNPSRAEKNLTNPSGVKTTLSFGAGTTLLKPSRIEVMFCFCCWKHPSLSASRGQSKNPNNLA